MLKHPSITLSRVNLWLRDQLQSKLELATEALSVEWCPVAHFTQAEAAKSGPWTPVETGFAWGPAYREGWFRITGKLPSEWIGKEVKLRANVGGERTLWQDNCPARGIDDEHELCRLADAATGKEKIEFYVQSHARAPHVRVFGDIPPAKPETEKVDRVELVLFHTELQPLAYDVEFCLSLLKQVPDTDPGYGTILRALNESCNVWAEEGPDRIARSRKLIKDSLGSLTGELKHTITAVGHAHLDTAWLWPLRITHLKMAHTAATQLYQMERFPEYVYAHSQASQYEWVENEYPALFKKIREAAARGQWEPVGSMWVEADCNLTGAESLIRQFLYGRRYFQQKFGKVTDDMFLPDVFGYAAALPQILNKFGIKYFCTQKISWNQFNKFPHNTFWWQGIDGTKVWSHFPPADTYCGMCTPEEMIQSVKNHKDQTRSDQSLYLFGYGDGGGGPTEKHIEFIRRARTAPYLPDVESRKTVRDFYSEAKAKSKDLVTWSGELYLEGHRGTLTSQADNKKANRECEFLLRDIELLACFDPGFPKAYPAAEIESLWKLVLLNQFHDIIPGSSVPEVYVDSDADYADIRARGAAILTDSLRRIAERIDSRDAARPIGLFQNATLGGQAEMPWSEPAAPQSLVAGLERIPVQLVEEFGERKIIFATPVEALGAVCIADLSDQPASPRGRLKAGTRKIENNEFSVRFDAHGNITSIQSMDDHPIEFIEPGKLANMFQLLDDRPLFWEAWDVDVFAYETAKDLVKSESFEIVERGPVRVAVEIVKKFGSSTIRQRISLGPTPGIRFDTWVDWREERKMLKVAFPLNVNAPRATYEIQFGCVERPTHRNTTWDLARFEVCAQKWADVSEGGYGVALLNNGKYGHDCHQNVLRLSLLRSPKAPDPGCDMGEHHFSYVLLPHYDQLHHADVVAAAYSLNAPTRAVEIKPTAGVTGELPRLVSVGSRDVVIEAVKKAEDSNRLIVRLYECHNTRGTTELTCARPIKKAWLCDLNEEIQIELDVQDQLVALDYRPFDIITVMLEV